MAQLKKYGLTGSLTHLKSQTQTCRFQFSAEAEGTARCSGEDCEAQIFKKSKQLQMSEVADSSE